MLNSVDEKEIEEVIEEKGYADIDRVEVEDEVIEDEGIDTDIRLSRFDNYFMKTAAFLILEMLVFAIFFVVATGIEINDIPFKDQVTIDAKQAVEVIQYKLKISDKDMDEVVEVAKAYGYSTDDMCFQNDFAILFNVALTKVDSSVLKGNYKASYDKVKGSSYERMSSYITLYNKYIAELHNDERQVNRKFLIAVFDGANLKLSNAKAATTDAFKHIDIRGQNVEDTDSGE